MYLKPRARAAPQGQDGKMNETTAPSPRPRADKASSDDREALIGLIYSAAADPDGWDAVFARLRSLFSGHTAIYERLHSAPENHQLLVTDLDPEFVERYNGHYNARNVWATSPLNQAAPVVISERIIRPNELERTDFYGEWLRPQRLRHALTSPLLRKTERSLNLGLVRDGRKGEYSAAEAEYLHGLLPHFQRAMEIASRLEAATVTQRVSLESVTAAGACLILADGSGRIVFATANAERMLAEKGALCASNGRLRARGRTDDSRLRRALAAAVPGLPAAAGGRGDIFTVEAPDSGARHTVTVNPLGDTNIGFFHRGQLAVVIVGTVADERAIPADTLQQVFGLTPAEARLASALCAGEALADYAARAGVGVTTAKSHLRALFAKLGVNRQADLVRAIVADPVLLRHGG